MNSEISKKIITLESVSASVDSVSASVKSIAESISLLATKEELKALATKEDIKDLASKEELTSLATKDDLKNLATKDEMAKLATKEELKNLVSKEDLKNLRAYLGFEFSEVRDGVSSLNLTTEVMGEDLERQIDNIAITSTHEFDGVNIKLDEMEKHTVDFQKEFYMKMGQMQNQLDNVYTNYPNRNEHMKLENRVQVLEGKVFA